MEQDDYKTDVIFYYERDAQYDEDVFAFFPNEIADLEGNNMCYHHIGQHSACCKEYLSECQKASETDYKNLASELESIGYNLTILNKY